MRLPLALLASCMLLTGTINTIATKIQDSVIVGADAAGRPRAFFHPGFQTACMFAGEALCLVPFALQRWARRHSARRAALSTEERTAARRRLRKAALAFAVPTLCDICGTTLLNTGLFFTTASAYQMLRGTLVIFAGLLTILLLKRRLHLHHWLGMVLIVAGAALVGASSLMYGNAGAQEAPPGAALRSLMAASNPLLGDSLVVLAQLAAGLQFVCEEKFLVQYRAPVLLAVGAEGAWGLALSVVALPLLSVLRGPGGAPLDDVRAALREVRADRTLQWTTAACVASIGAFNFFGVSVTGRLSGASRATIDACRTIFVWMYALGAGWERFHHLQVVGFVVLVSGTSLYNNILTSCLPAPPPREYRRHPRSGRSRRGDHGGGELAEPLLLGEEAGAEPGVEAAAPVDEQQLQGAGLPRRAQGFARSPSPLGRRPVGRPPLPIGAAAASTKYSMARSITILPSAFSPHSLGDSPGGTGSYWQSESGEYGTPLPPSEIEAGYASGNLGSSESSSGCSSGSDQDEEEGRQQARRPPASG